MNASDKTVRNVEGVTIGPCEVHVWRAVLDVPELLLSGYEATLSPDEKLRASRFYSPSDRNHFVASRGILRRLAGRYLSISPEMLEFRYASAGKPYLPNDSGLNFNVSHSRGVALYAFVLGCEIGIDLEAPREELAIMDLAKRFFSKREGEELRAMPSEFRLQAFFRCWTRKEAYIKACGRGLQLPLDSFDVSLAPGEGACFLAGVPKNWHLVDISEQCGMPAALVVDARSMAMQLNFRHYNRPSH